MNATLLMTDEPSSIYRRDPSPEVDHDWIKISDTRPISVSESDISALGISPEKAVKFNESFGLGQNAYAARLDVLHQVRCLDAIRREAYWDYYYAKKYPNGQASSPEMHKLHPSH